MPRFGDFERPKDGNDPSRSKALRNDWEGTLLQACQLAKGRGELPGAMARLVDGFVNPKVPWSQVLRSWLREQCSDDWNWLAPAMEYEGCGFILPSLKSERMGSVVFCTDTSGSIGAELLKQFQSEKQACLDEMRPSKLVDIYCDARIQKVVEYSSGDVIAGDCPGCGGTVAQPVWDYAAKMHPVPKCIVYLTDMDIHFGKDPGVPVLWVNFGGGDKQAPFGEVVCVQ
jgi:predicted metal-dependent peptidase